MAINWQNLRSWNASQNTAFETLCCQLAEYESAPEGSTFIRKGTPDAGVECFWRLPNGDEWGWQAKFFLSPPDDGQWRQLDESVKAALKKHPRLTSYTICLPIDRPDPRIEDQKWFMDKWDEHVKKWEEWAQAERMSVEFRYWGEHEIWERLSREEHRGRRFFWFNKELFSQQWFENCIEEAIANVGPRYTPELNVELPIARLFDGLGRTPEFYNRIEELSGKLRKVFSKVQSRIVAEFVKIQMESLISKITQLLSVLEGVDRSEIKPIDLNSIVELSSQSDSIAWECIRAFEAAAEERKKETSSRRKRARQQASFVRNEDFSYERHHFSQLTDALSELEDFAKGSEARLANTGALLLAGEAGTGKTHLFCDVAKRRITFGFPTVLLLGKQFRDGEPWSQIARLLGLSCTKEEFLGALEAAAQAQGAKGLILIDALNEGAGKAIWDKHLAGMLTTLTRYQWVGLAVSVRTSYEDIIIPQGLIPNRLIRAEHHGFADHEYEATRTFFDHFGIERPSVPLLTPEFQNPLFLTLFCQGLRNQGLTKIPQGLRGITSIFNFYIESVNDKLSKPESLNFDSKSRIIQKAVDKLAEVMADRGSRWLTREEAQTAVNAFLPRGGYEESLFRHLVAEGLLSEDRFRIGDDEYSEVIHFSYERFTDHIIAKYLLDKHLDPANPSHSFEPYQPLGSLVKDGSSCWQNRGIIEAFSIQLPERIRKELPDIAPICADCWPVREAFVESVIWRDPKAISDATLEYVNRHVIQYEHTHNQFLNALFTVASNPDHPYNADFLHSHLIEYEMAERDTWWSTFLHEQYGNHDAVDRLVDWAWSAEDKSHIDDESIRLCGVALVWFLTTSNRFLRDRATKALVSLLTSRIHVLGQIMQRFHDVNDPYVLERLLAVAYGCAMRSTDDNAIAGLAQDVYKWIFENGTPPPNILIRDYARGVIEVALHRGVSLEVDIQKIRPPYKSEWLSEILTEEELEKEYGQWWENMPDEERSRLRLYRSVMDDDFARYVIGTNSGLFEWSSRRLGEPPKPSKKDMYEEFVQSLTDKQERAWEYSVPQKLDR